VYLLIGEPLPGGRVGAERTGDQCLELPYRNGGWYLFFLAAAGSHKPANRRARDGHVANS